MKPATQLQSWDEIQSTVSEKRLKVLDIIRRSERGATLFEIVESIGWPVNRVSGRVTELKKLKLIHSEGTRKNPESGAQGNVWYAIKPIRVVEEYILPK
jgi:predicted transcriptional regulator